MDRTLDRLASVVAENERLRQIEKRNRLRLLWTACLCAMAGSVGLAFSYDTLTTSNSFAPGQAMPGWPWTLVVVAGVGGIVLLAGMLSRRLAIQRVGLWFLFVLYGTLVVMFTGNIVNRITDDYPAGIAPPAVYAAPLYAHLAVAMLIQIRTTSKLIREGERS